MIAGDVPRVQRLLAGDVNVDAVDPLQWDTALAEAVRGGCRMLVTLLLDAGADPTVVHRDGAVPLALAVNHNHRALARELIEAGADSTQSSTAFPPNSALHEAVGIPRRRLIPLLIRSASDLDAGLVDVDPFQSTMPSNTALDFAARLGRVRVGAQLLDAGATPTQYALYEAIRGGHPAFAKLLLRASVPVDEPESFAELARAEGQPWVARLIRRRYR